MRLLLKRLNDTGSTFDGKCVLVSFALAFNCSFEQVENLLWQNGTQNCSNFNQIDNVFVTLLSRNICEWIKPVAKLSENDFSSRKDITHKWQCRDGNLYFKEIAKYFCIGKYFLFSNKHIAYLEDGNVYDIYYDNVSICKYIAKINGNIAFDFL
jgi:hypothetical protein